MILLIYYKIKLKLKSKSISSDISKKNYVEGLILFKNSVKILPKQGIFFNILISTIFKFIKSTKYKTREIIKEKIIISKLLQIRPNKYLKTAKLNPKTHEAKLGKKNVFE